MYVVMQRFLCALIPRITHGGFFGFNLHFGYNLGFSPPGVVRIQPWVQAGGGSSYQSMIKRLHSFNTPIHSTHSSIHSFPSRPPGGGRRSRSLTPANSLQSSSSPHETFSCYVFFRLGPFSPRVPKSCFYMWCAVGSAPGVAALTRYLPAFPTFSGRQGDTKCHTARNLPGGHQEHGALPLKDPFSRLIVPRSRKSLKRPGVAMPSASICVAKNESSAEWWRMSCVIPLVARVRSKPCGGGRQLPGTRPTARSLPSWRTSPRSTCPDAPLGKGREAAVGDGTTNYAIKKRGRFFFALWVRD